MENLPIAKPLIRQIAEMPLNTAKLLCGLLVAREKDEAEMRFSVSRLVTLASGTKGGNTTKAFLPAIKSLSDDTFVTVDVKAKDLLDYSKESEDPKKVIRVSGPLISTSMYDSENGEVILKINPDFFPILDRTKSNWVALDLDVARKLRSDYALKLYCWLITHLGGHKSFEFDWHFGGSGEKEESVAEYFDLEDKTGYQNPSEIKIKIFERYLPRLQKLLEDTIDLQWSYIEKKRAHPRGREHAKFTESIHITMTRKDEKTPKKERPSTDVGEWKSPNSRPARPIENQPQNTTESDKHKPENKHQEEVLVTSEIKTITDFYNEAIQAKAGSYQAYSYTTISRYVSPLLQSGWSVDGICSLIEANRAYYMAVKHPEHVKKPQLVFNVQEERLDKIRPFMRSVTEILIEKYCLQGANNGSIGHIPADKFWLLDYETQEAWLGTMPYDSMPKDIQEECDRRHPEWKDAWKELLETIDNMAW